MATDHSSSKLAELKAAVTDTVLQAQVTHLANICFQLADGVRSQHGTSMSAAAKPPKTVQVTSDMLHHTVTWMN